MGEEPNSGGDGGDIGGLRRTRVWGSETGDSRDGRSRGGRCQIAETARFAPAPYCFSQEFDDYKVGGSSYPKLVILVMKYPKLVVWFDNIFISKNVFINTKIL
jgi:hypothetical protein